MSEQVGVYTLFGTTAQNAVLRPMCEQLSAIHGPVLGPIDVIPKKPDDMPPAYGGNAIGLWRDGPNDIWLDERFGEYPVVKTFVHESGHAYDDHALNPIDRAWLCDQVTPRAARWFSGSINGTRFGEAAYPSEAFAELYVILFGGFRRGAYPGIFVRDFLRPTHAAIRARLAASVTPPAPEPDPVPSPPSPPDPTIPLLTRIAELETANTELLAWQAQVRGVVCL
jgi:hypothetical protein